MPNDDVELLAKAVTLPRFLTNPDPEIFLTGSYLVLDFETTILEKGSPLNDKNRILCAVWSIRDRNRVVTKQLLGGENDLERLVRDISSVDFIVAHNAKFELGWLRRCGLDLRTVLVFDTMLAEWVLLGNGRDTGLSLEASSRRRGLVESKDVVGEWLRSGVDSENIPSGWLVRYCEQDVRLTRELFERQVVLLRDRNQLHLIYQRGLVCACLADIEFNGIKLDESRVYEEYDRIRREYGEVQNQLAEFGAEVNWESPKQVATLLYDTLGFEEPKDRRGNPIRTGKGARSASKTTLELLSPKTVQQKRFIELYKKSANLNARLTKSLQFFKGVCDEYNGIFYGAFNQGNTATHRLSSSGRKLEFKDGSVLGAQFQNLPREYKKLFGPKRKDWLVSEIDGSQLEFRVAAELGHDQLAYEEIATGVDVHSNTVSAYADFGEKITRQEAKPQTFKPLFGGRGNTPAERAYCDFFQKKYAEIYKTQTAWTRQVLSSPDGELITPYGMRFYWPGSKMNRYGRVDNETSIFNYPIQGFSTGEIIPIAVIFFWHRIKDLAIELVNTIHDSVIAEVAPEAVDDLKQIAIQSFTHDVYTFLKECYKYEFQVPLGVEIKVGEHWSEGEGQKHNVFPNG